MSLMKTQPYQHKKADLCRKLNMVDSMVQKLEKYANNLETIVAERTKELVAEKEKTDQLLHKMLPKSVSSQACLVTQEIGYAVFHVLIYCM